MQKLEKITECLNLIKKGKEIAILELYTYMNERMTFFAKNYLYDKSLVQDVIQDAVINVIKYIHSFDESKNSINWIIKIVKNLALKYNSGWNTISYYELNENELSYDDMLEDKCMISRTTQELNAEEKELFVLYFVYEHSIREIANIKKESKTRIARKTLSLKNKLFNNFSEQNQ